MHPITIFTRLAVIAVILFQAPSTLPIKLGDVGKTLTDSEAAEIAHFVSPNGPAPWLLDAYRGGSIAVEMVNAYLPPETITKEVRRGKTVLFTLSRPVAPNVVRHPSSLVGSGHYAQVSIAGRDFDTVQGDMDFVRPFQLFGNSINDNELIRLVALIRSKAGILPIWWINRTEIDTLVVRLVDPPSPKVPPTTNLTIAGYREEIYDNEMTISRSGNEWKVLKIGRVVN